MSTDSASLLLRDKIETMKLSQRAAATKIGISQPRLNQILNGHYRISADMAVRIEQALGLSAESLLNSQKEEELRAARKSRPRLQPRKGRS